MNEPITSALCELPGAKYTQLMITITVIAKLCIHEIRIIHGSFLSWFPGYHIMNIYKLIMEIYQSRVFWKWFITAVQSFLKISYNEYWEVKE